jgi:hypothetical protein
VTLAYVRSEAFQPAIDGLVWVVNMDVSGRRLPLHGPPGSAPYTTYLYQLAFVDADTGTLLHNISKGAPLK